MISPTRWAGKCAFAAFVRNITQRKEADRKVQAQLEWAEPSASNQIEALLFTGITFGK
jgi:hypothetical protein